MEGWLVLIYLIGFGVVFFAVPSEADDPNFPSVALVVGLVWPLFVPWAVWLGLQKLFRL